MKKVIWRLFLKRGWYQITWNSGLFPIKDRAFWDGKNFKYKGHGFADTEAMSIFVRRSK